MDKQHKLGWCEILSDLFSFLPSYVNSSDVFNYTVL